MQQASATGRGIVAMVAGMASFVANDTLVKYVGQSLPAAQLIALRGMFAVSLLLALVFATGAARHLHGLRNRRVLLRSACDAVATATYLVSLFHLPLANATAINMAAPLFVTLLAIVVLGERVPGGRWLAIAAGFAGVLLVVQPSGSAFNGYALVCLGATALQAARDLLTRTIRSGIPTLVITLATALGVTLFAGAWSLVQAWEPVSMQQLALLAAAAAFLSGGSFLLTVALRTGELSLVAPFRYSALLFATGMGYAVWRDVPNALAVGGIVLLVAAGVALLRRNRAAA